MEQIRQAFNGIPGADIALDDESDREPTIDKFSPDVADLDSESEES